jgi:hypothetical protein
MSRYQGKSNDGHYTFAWGYDRPLSEYFFSKFDNQAEEGEEDCVFSIMSHTTTQPYPAQMDKMHWTNAEIISLMNAEAAGIIPDDHLLAIALDMPF